MSACGGDSGDEAVIPEACPSVTALSTATGLEFTDEGQLSEPRPDDVAFGCDFEYRADGADAGSFRLRIIYYSELGELADFVEARVLGGADACESIDVAGADACALTLVDGATVEDANLVEVIVSTERSLFVVLVGAVDDDGPRRQAPGLSSLAVGTYAASVVVDQLPAG